MDVRRADDDIVLSKEGAHYHNGITREEDGSSESTDDCHMAAIFRSFMRSTGSWTSRNVGKTAEATLSRTRHPLQLSRLSHPSTRLHFTTSMSTS